MFLFSWFKSLGKLVVKGLSHAKDLGLNDEIVGKALDLVKEAAGQPTTKDEKREFVVKALTMGGVPSPIARLAVELAVIIYKKAK